MHGKPKTFWKQALVVFGVSAAVYFGGFWAVEQWRTHRGPWTVTFTTNTTGAPTIVIASPGLGLTNVRVVFPGTNLPSFTGPISVHFDAPPRRDAVPFGQVKFLDTTVLPGTVTFDLFGHEIELLPRTLIVNKREHPWRSGEELELPPR